MATLFMARSLNSPAAQHVPGMGAAIFHISASLSISGGDTWVIGKLPNRAIPLFSVFYPAGQVVAKFGTSASQELFFNSSTYSAGTNMGTNRLGRAFQISLSDDVAVNYETVTMVATGGISLGVIGDLLVTYVMPGQGL